MRHAGLIVFFLFFGCVEPNESESMLSGVPRMPEYDLITKIKRSTDVIDRERLIAELESTPVGRVAFHSRWIQIHEVRCSECWSNNGFDPSRSTLPEDVQLLLAMYYGGSDIDNGGLLQFMSNPGGVMAPEIQVWSEKAGLQELSGNLANEINRLGEQFPRSQTMRASQVTHLVSSMPAALLPNPLEEFDSEFYAMKAQITEAADSWLRQKCGVQSLSTHPKSLPRD